LSPKKKKAIGGIIMLSLENDFNKPIGLDKYLADLTDLDTEDFAPGKPFEIFVEEHDQPMTCNLYKEVKDPHTRDLLGWKYSGQIENASVGKIKYNFTIFNA
jgi:hypothetical protein